jgi:hypothetical protein
MDDDCGAGNKRRRRAVDDTAMDDDDDAPHGAQFEGELDGARFKVTAGKKEPAAVYEPVSLATLDVDYADRDHDCFGCQYNFGKPLFPEKEPQMYRLWSMWDSNRGVMHEWELCKQMAELYVDLYVRPMAKAGMPTLAWGADMIYRHLYIHMINQRQDILTIIRDLKTEMRFLKDHMVESDVATGKRRMRLDYHKAYLDSAKHLEALLKKV